MKNTYLIILALFGMSNVYAMKRGHEEQPPVVAKWNCNHPVEELCYFEKGEKLATAYTPNKEYPGWVTMMIYTRAGNFGEEWDCEKDGFMFVTTFPNKSYPIIDKNDKKRIIIRSNDGEELASFECDDLVWAVDCWAYGAGNWHVATGHQNGKVQIHNVYPLLAGNGSNKKGRFHNG